MFRNLSIWVTIVAVFTILLMFAANRTANMIRENNAIMLERVRMIQ